MSVFNEILSKIEKARETCQNNFEAELQKAFDALDKCAQQYSNGHGRGREPKHKGKANTVTALQSINEDDVEPKRLPEATTAEHASSISNKHLNNDKDTGKPNSPSTEEPQKNIENGSLSKKRNKDEVDGMSSPEQDKRQKRNASVKAQNIISKQVNVNLNQKMRREDNNVDDESSRERHSQKKRQQDDNKENAEPTILIANIKQEKLSLPPQVNVEPEELVPDIPVKTEVVDEVAMPPPALPIRKPRKVKAKNNEQDSFEEESSGKRSMRGKKQSEAAPLPARTRSTRSSSRVNSTTVQAETSVVPPEPRPKRTRAKKKRSESEEEQATQEGVTNSSPEKPRPKRTKRALAKASEKESAETNTESHSDPEVKAQAQNTKVVPEMETSPIITKENSKTKSKPKAKDIETNIEQTTRNDDKPSAVVEETRITTVKEINSTVVISNKMDETVVLPNGVYEHNPQTPKALIMNETIVMENAAHSTMIIDKAPHNKIMDETVVINKESQNSVTDDNSLLTDDNSDIHTPPREIPSAKPISAVKEKVQQFEQLATRTTRTKTRAMVKNDETNDNQTPPDKIGTNSTQSVLSAETLKKMNNLIFNGKAPQTSTSAQKPRANNVVSNNTKSLVTSSASKATSIARHREASEESVRSDKEDARKKKEVLLEARKEQQKRKREEKMAAAAAARSAAEQSRERALQAAVRERREKQAHADLGKRERLREAERKKQDLTRKLAETEERRRAEEQARQQRLAEEQQKAETNRKKQQEEAEAMKKEAAIMAREMEKRQKEYNEKQKLKQRLESNKVTTPLKGVGTPYKNYTMEPVYMQDGFQYLNSDEEDIETSRVPVPAWSSDKTAKHYRLRVQSLLRTSVIDRLFSVRTHSPDLREIFPNIERHHLKRTSSAVWRTPPSRAPLATLPE